jgi:cytochrome P450
MKTLTSDLMVLEAGQTPPAGTQTPPRQPLWTDTFTFIANPDRFCHQNVEQYGPIFKTHLFGQTTVFVGTEQANHMAFNGDLRYTEISLPPTTMSMFGEYSLFQRPDLHQERKSALRPGLAGQVLAGYLPFMNQVIDQSLRNWSVPGSIALFPGVEQICFDLLVPLLLGIKIQDSDPTSFVDLPIASQKELKALYRDFFNGFYGLLHWRSPLTLYGRGMAARDRLIQFMQAIIRRRRAAQEAIDPTADFLSMMLASQQENPQGVFSDALIQNQCLLQLWASHYELSGLVSSLIYQLGQHPTWIQRLRQEQATIVATEPFSGTFSWEQLKQMQLLEAVIKETLRLLPPTSTASRRLTKSIVLDGMLYEKGWVLIAEPRISHYLPEYFQNPRVFNPDRFLGNDHEGSPYSFIPFGGGVHACLGAQLAMVATKTFLAQWLRKFDWELTGEAEFEMFPLRQLKPNYQIRIEPSVVQQNHSVCAMV